MMNTLTGAFNYCLPNDPVIGESEFEKVGDIRNDKEKLVKYFELTLSMAGFETLQQLLGRLPGYRVALVVGGHIAGIYDNKGKISRVLPIRGASDSYDVEWIHENIQKKKP
jgi:hypothetical protein